MPSLHVFAALQLPCRWVVTLTRLWKKGGGHSGSCSRLTKHVFNFREVIPISLFGKDQYHPMSGFSKTNCLRQPHGQVLLSREDGSTILIASLLGKCCGMFHGENLCICFMKLFSLCYVFVHFSI